MRNFVNVDGLMIPMLQSDDELGMTEVEVGYDEENVEVTEEGGGGKGEGKGEYKEE